MSLDCYVSPVCCALRIRSIERCQMMMNQMINRVGVRVDRGPWTAPAQEKRGQLYFRLYRESTCHLSDHILASSASR